MLLQDRAGYAELGKLDRGCEICGETSVGLGTDWTNQWCWLVCLFQPEVWHSIPCSVGCTYFVMSWDYQLSFRLRALK